jgi:putative DNA primase/helicase
MLSTDGQFWHYDVRLWRVVQDQWVSGKVLEIIQANPVKNQKTASLLSQILTLLKAKLAVKDDVLSFVDNPPPVINCTNGELWIEQDGSVELRPHRPESHLRHCLDVIYDPKAACPEYDKALHEIFAKADNPKAMVRHWNEVFGYVIQAKRNIPAIVIMSGAGDNGKTVLIRTVMRLLGHDLVHAQRVDDLDKSRFAIGSLFGKLLFVDDDVRAGARLPDGMLKTISEAKEVTGELKYRSSFNFIVRTVPVLLCNNIPSVADLSHGMRRRLMVLPFDRIFTEDEKDPDLFEGIWAKELAGVLNQALRGYKRLLECGAKFKFPKAVKRATTAWLQQANPLPAFLKAHCIAKPQGRCLMQDFYQAYSAWTKAGLWATPAALVAIELGAIIQSPLPGARTKPRRRKEPPLLPSQSTKFSKHGRPPRRLPHLSAGPPGSGALVSFARSGLNVRWGPTFHSLLEPAEACDVPVRPVERGSATPVRPAL